MAEINDIVEERFPQLLGNFLSQECDQRGIEFDGFTQDAIETRLEEFLISRRTNIREVGMSRAEDEGIDPEHFYEEYATESAASLTREILSAVDEEDRNQVMVGDFYVGLMSLEICHWYPIC